MKDNIAAPLGVILSERAPNMGRPMPLKIAKTDTSKVAVPTSRPITSLPTVADIPIAMRPAVAPSM
ncbi:MAG: hypothetical protein BWX58_00929 [Deltaproteobacteria bacterium ADurb.Bin026]|nr:MAG: hypothetical protein BWX58_00929 [Deltaproteobacteria bacterium ADurb.Bin026]